MTSAAVAEIEFRAVKNGVCLSTIFSADNHTDKTFNIGGRSARIHINPTVNRSAPEQIFIGASQTIRLMVGPNRADAAGVSMKDCRGSWASFCAEGRFQRVGSSRMGDLFAIASCPRVSGGWGNNGPEIMYNQLIQSGAYQQTITPARPERQPVRSAPVSGTPVAPSAPASTGGWFSAPATAAPVETRPAPRTETRTGGSGRVRACRNPQTGCFEFNSLVP
ncbi:MAG: hypothetical protein J0L77_04525 [Alphaproteobacteria bacterium]|nr:hypothetical protein [Alphaproteobacteria bacterium]